MSTNVEALRYLIIQTTRNRIAGQLKRLRQPKYLGGLVFGLAYFYFFFFRQRVGGGGPKSFGLLVDLIPMIGAFFLLLGMAGIWFTKASAAALAFAPAEVQFLFTGPLSRRALIAYRVVRSQLVVLLNAVIWSILAHRFGSSMPWPQRFAIAWAVVSVLSLHRLASALVRVPPVEGSRLVVVRAVRVAVVLAFLFILRGATPLFTLVSDLGGAAGLRAFAPQISTGMMGVVLFPFRVLLAPLTAGGTGSFLASYLPVLGIIALHLVWVMSLVVPFEESAATASATMAAAVARVRRFQGGGVSAPTAKKVRSAPFKLSPVGNPVWAIVWKNTMAFLRTRMYFPLIIFGAIGIVLSRMPGSAEDGQWASVGGVGMILLMLTVMGPRFLRNDLRLDMLSLPLLKTYPLTGRQMVVAQLASPALLLTMLQCVLLVLGFTRLPNDVAASITPVVGIGAVILLPLLLLGLNVVGLAIQNGSALLFPGWIRLGADGGGIEAMGQNMMVSIGSILALVLLLLLPAGLGFGVGAIGIGMLSVPAAPAVLAAVAVAVLVIGLELLLIIQWLGGVFERSDPSGG